jgi:DUF1126 PH-like domain
LRFHAAFHPDFCIGPADHERAFVVSYFLSSKDLSIFEPPLLNSGVLGGKFLERAPVPKPGSHETYSAQDLHVGARLNAAGRAFSLLSADEYTLNLMESHSELFPCAHYGAIVSKMQASVCTPDVCEAFKDCIIMADPSGQGSLTTIAFHVRSHLPFVCSCCSSLTNADKLLWQNWQHVPVLFSKTRCRPCCMLAGWT